MLRTNATRHEDFCLIIFTPQQAGLLDKENVPDCSQNEVRNWEMRLTKVDPYKTIVFVRYGFKFIWLSISQKIYGYGKNLRP